MGLYPKMFSEPMHASVLQLIEQASTPKF
jgi:hypothetical protein